MKTIIAGTRSVTAMTLVKEAVEKSGFNITEVVSGRCRGVDQLGEDWATENRIPIKPFEPDWPRLGRFAGPERNERMAQYADALIAIWDGASFGTNNMINLAKQYNLKIYVLDLSK